ncbi:hypothetical protein [Kitasatospora aureofaciens]
MAAAKLLEAADEAIRLRSRPDDADPAEEQHAQRAIDHLHEGRSCSTRR